MKCKDPSICPYLGQTNDAELCDLWNGIQNSTGAGSAGSGGPIPYEDCPHDRFDNGLLACQLWCQLTALTTGELCLGGPACPYDSYLEPHDSQLCALWSENEYLKGISSTTTTTTTTTKTTAYLGTVLVIGGDTSKGATSSVETLLGEPIVSELPRIRWGHVAFVLPGSQIVVCGGKGQHHNIALSKTCIFLPPQTSSWSNHSRLNQPRIYASEVTMPSGQVFLLGGWYSERTSEVLLPGNSTWSRGPHLPHPLDSACALPINETTFVAIGGGMYHTKVISYNTRWELWNDDWPQLAEGRRGHSCARFGSNLMVAGGYSYSNFDYSDSTIIIDAITGLS